MSAKHAPGVNHLRAKVEDVAYYVRLNLGTALASTSSGAIHRFSKSNLGPWFDQGENSFFNLILKRYVTKNTIIPSSYRPFFKVYKASPRLSTARKDLF
jgi:hypothetical protein